MAMSRDKYDRMTKIHVVGDKEVSWKELEESQKVLRNHGRALARVFGLGKAEGKRTEGGDGQREESKCEEKEIEEGGGGRKTKRGVRS